MFSYEFYLAARNNLAEPVIVYETSSGRSGTNRGTAVLVCFVCLHVGMRPVLLYLSPR